MLVNIEALRARFDAALRAVGARSEGDALFDELASRYREPHRHYHTLAHIDACLVWLDWFSGHARHPGEVELALWFHDAVYDPRAGGNERRSAELARERLASVGVPSTVLDRIAGHVLATEEHAAADGDAALVVDLDLTILGASGTDFDRFEGAIRSEYAHVSEDQYVLGRRRVLEGFLTRTEIYSVSKVREELEARARANLTRRIAELSRPT